MFFYLSKLLWFVAAPPNLLCLVLAGALFWRFGSEPATTVAQCCIVILLVLGILPVGTLLTRPLEDRFPQAPADLAPPTGIVVLGGSTDETITADRGQVTLTDAAARVTTAVELSRRFPETRLVFSGGSASLFLKERTEAEDTRRLWIALGVSPDRITLEDRSRNTFENAKFTTALVRPTPGQRWLLVTSAMHMPRAVGLFRADGFPVIPYPVDYRTTGTWHDFLPTGDVAAGLRSFEGAMREWVGLTAYRLTGKTRTWFPGP